MPSSTFFRLPEEKRQRLLNAARGEFKRTRFSEASINRIILNAHIPRGSFYQYFTDKEDLFQYLMSAMRDYFYATLMQLLEEGKGNLFSVPLGAFDRLMTAQGGMDPVLGECVEIMQINPGMDISWLFTDWEAMLPAEAYAVLDLRELRRQDSAFVSNVFYLILSPLAFAIAESLRNPAQLEEQRRLLAERIEIIQQGARRQDAPVGA